MTLFGLSSLGLPAAGTTPALPILVEASPLVGAVTMVCTPLAGGQVDRRGPGLVNLVCIFGVIATAGALVLTRHLAVRA